MEIGEKVYHFTELDSTNDFAKGLIAGASEGTVVVAERQRRGKGRLGKSWWSPEGGLWFSIILGGNTSQLIPLMAGVALCEVLRGLGLNVGIKWPNDLVTGGKKLAGILTELEGERIILGVGLNLNISHFPDEIRGVATSLSLETGRTYVREEVLKSILRGIEKWLGSLRGGDIPGLLNRWREYSNILGKEVVVRTPRGRLQGRATDIAQDGGLLLELPDGSQEKVLAGECSLRVGTEATMVSEPTIKGG